MANPKFTQEYKEKLDFLMQEAESPKTKEILAKIYGLKQETGEALLKCVESGVFG